MPKNTTNIIVRTVLYQGTRSQKTLQVSLM
jgi:hypothetical protein